MHEYIYTGSEENGSQISKNCARSIQFLLGHLAESDQSIVKIKLEKTSKMIWQDLIRDSIYRFFFHQ